MRSLVRYGPILGVVALPLASPAFAQQSLIWPTPEQDGTVRDLTHLPAVPFYQTDPTNLQHQLWSQPASALTPSLNQGTIGPDYGDRANLYETTPLFQSMKYFHPDRDAADRLLEQYRRQNGAR